MLFNEHHGRLPKLAGELYFPAALGCGVEDRAARGIDR